jgi:hypothetical protein
MPIFEINHKVQITEIGDDFTIIGKVVGRLEEFITVGFEDFTFNSTFEWDKSGLWKHCGRRYDIQAAD